MCYLLRKAINALSIEDSKYTLTTENNKDVLSTEDSKIALSTKNTKVVLSTEDITDLNVNKCRIALCTEDSQYTKIIAL